MLSILSSRFSQKLMKQLEFPLFCEIVTSGIILSLCAFEIFNVDSFFSIEFIARVQFANYLLIELFIFSRAAENNRKESEKITEKIYMSRWYDAKMNKRKLRPLLFITMQRANRSVKTSALGIFFISFETFLSVSESESTLWHQMFLESHFTGRPIQLFPSDALNSNTVMLKCASRRINAT